MYQPFGIGFSRDVLVRDFGARNVIYYDDNESELIPEDLKWRALRLNVDTYDFEYLREWRIKGGEFDFSKFPKEHLIVIAPNLHELNDLFRMIMNSDLILIRMVILHLILKKYSKENGKVLL